MSENTVTFENRRQAGLRRLVRADGTLSFDVTLSTDRGADAVMTTLSLAGPGQMTGLRPSGVRKVHPRKGAGDHRGGELAFIELRDPALPWAFSLTGAPTIGLICVPDQDGVIFDPTAVPNPVLTVLDVSALPPVPVFEAMAHVHSQTGHPSFARLLCPQELAPNRRFIAALVPLTDQGRMAGLGDAPLRSGDLSAPAWRDAAPGPVRLPVLCWWRFGTGTSRGAEDILRDLRKSDRISAPERLPLTNESTALLGLTAGTQVTRATLLVSQASALPKLQSLPPALDTTTPSGAPRLALPSYGRLYAEADDAGTALTAAAPRWFSDLNHTVSYRVMAGLGAELVRKHQDEILTFIRDSAGAIEEANALLARGHLSQRMAQAAYATLSALSDAAFLRIAGPALARTRVTRRTASGNAPTSAAAAITGSAHGAAAHPVLRRRIGRGASPLSKSGGSLVQAIADTGAEVRRGHKVAGAGALGRWGEDVQSNGRVFLDASSRDDPLRMIAQLRDLPPDRLGARPDPGRDALLQAGRRDAAIFELQPSGPPSLTPGLDAAVMADIRAALDPALAIPGRLRARITGAPEMARMPLPKRLLHDPVWPEPILERLFDLDPESLAPGLSDMRENTILGLTLDGAALEAVVAGANHEVLRELVWRGVPVGRRPSPIRRAFPAPQDPAAGAADAFDLAPMVQWEPAAPLGAGWAGRVGFMALIRTTLFHKHPDAVCYLCPAIRGNGVLEPDPNADLRYPVAMGQVGLDMVYLGFEASAAEMRGGTGPTDPAGLFLVFEVPKEGLSFGLGGRNAAASRTGADIARDGGWQTLDWDDFPGPVLIRPDLDGTDIGDLVWGRSAADMAAILREGPVLIALHGADLLGEAS